MPTRYPDAPVLGVGGIVFDRDRVLLVRRATPPRQGMWSLPGGRVELGETLEEALVREVAEETALEIDVVSLVDLFQYMERDGQGRVLYHYVVADYLCRTSGGSLRSGSDVSDALFVALDGLAPYELNAEASRMISLAWSRLRRRP